jgi:site-specific DNA-methyltransferase (cytosine-N4-specific)
MIFNADCREILNEIPDKSIDLILTSPPYYQRRVYTDSDKELGREIHPLEYVKNIVDVFCLYKTKLKPTGSLLLNIGDSYFGTKGFGRNKGRFKRDWDQDYKQHKIPDEDGKYLQHKQLLLLPSRIAIGLQDAGFILRNDIIWKKNNAFPVPALDRKFPIYEHIFHFVISKKYYYNNEKAKHYIHTKDIIVANPVNKYGDHKASYSEDLIIPFVDIYCPEGGFVFDPFLGSGTTIIVAKKLGRKYGGCELSETFYKEVLSNNDAVLI